MYKIIHSEENTQILLPYSLDHLENNSSDFFKMQGVDATVSVYMKKEEIMQGGALYGMDLAQEQDDPSTYTVPYKYFYYRMKYLQSFLLDLFKTEPTKKDEEIIPEETYEESEPVNMKIPDSELFHTEPTVVEKPYGKLVELPEEEKTDGEHLEPEEEKEDVLSENVVDDSEKKEEEPPTVVHQNEVVRPMMDYTQPKESSEEKETEPEPEPEPEPVVEEKTEIPVVIPEDQQLEKDKYVSIELHGIWEKVSEDKCEIVLVDKEDPERKVRVRV
jgi:hypothetical protein